MAKPKQKVKTPLQQKPSENFLAGKEKYFLPTVIAITFLCFFPSLQDKFTNLDDTNYILDNPVVKNINAEDLKAIFSEQFVGNYQPLTMLSYMLDYKFFGTNPFGYHLINLIFYLFCVAFVFLIAEKLSANKIVAFITSLLFGVHTLHVESFTWVSKRKNCLY